MTDRLCPWCSATLPATAVDRCPACGASLVERGEDLPGLTHVDPAALRPGRPAPAKPRGILGFLTGEYAEPEAAAPEGSLAPPPDAVKMEMLRMELAAAEAELAAAEALARLEAEATAAAAAELAAEAGAATGAAVDAVGDAEMTDPDEKPTG